MLLDPQEDLAAVVGAERPDDLWRWLVRAHSVRSDPNSWLAEMVFRHLHGETPEEAWRTAGLMCTDPRWRQATGPLIRRIEESGLVEAERLDDLAVEFVLDEDYGWPVPPAWLRDGTVRMERPAPRNGQPAPVVVVSRPIQPPLRRWGAERAIRHQLLGAGDLLDAVAHHPARAGDHVLLGLLDACECLDDELSVAAIELGVTWSSGTVRLAALEKLAARDGPESAARLAATDRNEKVRRWGVSVRRASTKAPDGRAEVSSGGAGVTAEVSQPSLFDD